VPRKSSGRSAAKRSLCLFLLLLSGAAGAQTPTERVIVTAPRLNEKVTPNAIAHDFILHYTAPTILRDAIPRWQVGICPEVRGLDDRFADIVENHIRGIAAEAGAPLKPKGCRPNLSISFTSKPQTLLDNIRAKNAEVIGYHGANTITHPIQAWYVTGTKDIRGEVIADRDTNLAMEGGFWSPGPPRLSTTNTAPVTNVGGWRFRPDATSDLLYVTIIVDAAQTGRYQIDEIADYVTMLALTQTKAFDGCQPVASIANLLSADCTDGLKPHQITTTDIAFLHGVYAMDPGASLAVQQDQIAGVMASALAGNK
jgi:hypothetical protein